MNDAATFVCVFIGTVGILFIVAAAFELYEQNKEKKK